LGVVEEWQRHCELEGMAPVAEGFRNSTPGMKGRAVTGQHGYEQIAELAERGKARAARFFELLDARLAKQQFVAGNRYSVADITALIGHDFGTRTKVIALDHLPNLKRWHEAVSARPSAKA
jgi:glutathione S-transferase